jgi:hypothetical protein
MVHIQRCICGPLIQNKKKYENCMENIKFARRLLEKTILSEYEVLQVCPKNAGSQNVSFLASKGEAVGVTQIPSHNGT